MILKKALRQRPELKAEFQRICQSDTLSGDVTAALRKHPLFADIYIPDHINALRRDLDCPAKRGGARAQRGGILYSVAGRHGRACA